MNENLRQLVHLSSGLVFSALILVLDRATLLAILTAGIFAGFLIFDMLWRGIRVPVVSLFVDTMERREDLPGKGTFFYTGSALFCLVFFDLSQVFVGVVALSVLDSIATIAGLRFGRTRPFNRKSVEGTLAGAAAAAAILFFFLPLPFVLTVSALAGVAEHLSPLDDNLVIPPVVCLFLVLAGWPVV
ncbi:MAG TPA: phosphatidate cytidylyltransferase [Methanoculleus sp.]|nr:phosphatidate cytidylyltransferase [Methanoculleus sp.]